MEQIDKEIGASWDLSRSTTTDVPGKGFDPFELDSPVRRSHLGSGSRNGCHDPRDHQAGRVFVPGLPAISLGLSKEPIKKRVG